MRASHYAAAVLTLLLGSLSAFAGDAPKPGKTPKFTNRLAKETSPYLRMHQHNPVDWYPWGPEAFAKAKKENKLVFLSIGYSSCYWCHVMARESFEHEEVAKVLNAHFVSIKVDREERPEIDQIYMTALHALGQSGGWPLSMFLLPDGRPFFGGTYWPREDRVVEGETVRGFKSIAKVIHDLVAKKRDEAEKQATEMADATNTLLGGPRGIALVKLDRALLEGAVTELQESFDKTHGGFGRAPAFRGARFPLPCRLQFLLGQYERTKNKELLDMVTLMLDKMAGGGIYDQLGGGFHRYSTERTWTVPHFEKMLYDNAQLVEVYATAYRLTKNPLYKRIVAETIAYVQRDMMSPEGAFYSSQDAETDHEEGRSYVWTNKELEEVLTEKRDRAIVYKVYGLEEGYNFEGRYHILRRPRPLADIAKDLKIEEAQLASRLAELQAKLLSARAKREQPFLNKIALTSWSGEMIAGLATASLALEQPAYAALAKKAAEHVLATQKTKDGRLLRTYGAAPGQKAQAAVNGYLEDYAFLVHGLLNLHAATREERWLKEAKALTDTMLQHHGDAKSGGYYFTAHDHEKFFARAKDQYDGAQPSSNSAAVANLVRLWQLTGEKRYREEAEKSFRTFAGTMKAQPVSLVTMLHALDRYLEATAAKEK